MKIKKMLQGMKYTWKHKKAFLKIEKKLLGKKSFRGYKHDLDKLLIWYPLSWLLNKDAKWVQRQHRQINRHHLENKIVHTQKDYIEMIIDWECARYTKPDKPLNAFETLKAYYPDLEKDMLPLLKKLKLIK